MNEFSLPSHTEPSIPQAQVSHVVRIWFPQDWWFLPLNQNVGYFPQYISLFIVGLIAFRRGWFTRIPDAVGKRWFWVALINFVIFLLIFALLGTGGGSVNNFLGGLHWQALVFACWEAVMCVSLCTCLLVFFRKQVNHQGRIWNFLSANAYATYIVHPIILVSLAYSLHFVTLYPLLKYGLVVLIAIPCCFALGALVRIIPYAKRIF